MTGKRWLPEDLEYLRPHCRTAHQHRYLDLALKHLCFEAVDAELGHTKGTTSTVIGRIKRYARLHGIDPAAGLTRPVPAPFIAKAHSTFDKLDPESGQRTALYQWTKTELSLQERLEAIQEAVIGLCEGLPAIKRIEPPKAAAQDLCTTYIITDYHVGAYAWKPETGADWDLAIAERTLDACFSGMVARSPDARTAIIAQLGDFLDYDSLSPVTPTNRNVLDVDGRFAKVVRVAVDCIIRMINLALEKHETVMLLLAEGNHDLSSSVWLREMFSRLYADNPRVRLIKSESPYYAYKFGKCLIGFHHGHLTKKANLPMLFAQRYRTMWGQTEHCEVHVGHMHHLDVKDHGMVRVIQHPTLAAANAHTARAGYDAPREAAAITYHRNRGRWCTHYIAPEEDK